MGRPFRLTGRSTPIAGSSIFPTLGLAIRHSIASVDSAPTTMINQTFSLSRFFWAVEESMDVPAEASSLVTAARDGTDERYLHDSRMVSREILFPLITR